jgi:hypothetical protein
MYDKYSKAAPITTGSKIPTHKGILFSNSNSGSPSGVTMHFYRATGGTFSTLIQIAPSGSMLLPIEVHTLPNALPSGVTAFYLN